MGMQFTVALTGEVRHEIGASDLGIDLDNPNELLDVSSAVEFDDVQVGGTVTLEASVRIGDVMVSAEDLDGYDAETAIGEYVNPYGYGMSVNSADFEIT